MNRRAFIQRSVQGLSSVALSSTLAQFYSAPLFAQQSNGYRAVVCLFLVGGLDSNEAVVPMDDAYASYAGPRRNLALARSSLNPLQATSGKRLFGLHSALTSTAQLFNSGQAAILANVGTIARPTRKSDPAYTTELPTNLFSHPSQVGAWETALAASVSGTGWAGRVADALLASNGSSKMPTVVSTSGYSLMGQGLSTNQVTAATNTPNSADFLNTLTNLQQYFLAAEHGDGYNSIQRFLADKQQRTLTVNSVVSDAYAAGSVSTKFPGSPLGQQLQIIAKLIAGRSTHSTQRQIFVASDGSYDSHTTQTRSLNDRFQDVDACIAAFVAALKEIGMYDNVTLFTCSDFGRSLVQNSTGGTDHGWGGHHFVIGGSVKGGDMYGTFPDLVPGGSDDTNQLGIWIPTTATTQYIATMSQWLGVPASSLSTIFPELPNFASHTLPVLRA